MGIRSPFDRDSSSSHLVDKMVGNAYSVVRKVYDKLDEIAYVAGNAEAILEAGNAALTAVEGLEELGTPAGSSHIGHIAAGAGSVPTNVQTKLREAISVLDKGAAPGASAAVNTAAFLAAGPGALVPAGDFALDAAAVDLSLYHGPGIILYAGQRISLNGAGLTPRLVQKHVIELGMGFDNGTVDTQVFPGARRAPQGLAFVNVGGVDKLFMTQKTRGTSYTAEEYFRIVEFNANSGVPMAWSNEIQLGHGQDLTALVENDEVFLYTSHPTQTLGVLPLSGYDIYICAGQSNMVGFGTGITGADGR